MDLVFYQVDAFTDKRFGGNPAAVFILDAPVEDSWMKLTAREMNLSETAFLQKREDGYNLRWFTPRVEVDLCGHATLASAHILFETGLAAKDEEARFHTRSGLLTAAWKNGWIELNFPAKVPQACEAPAGLEKALGMKFDYVGKNKFNYIVEVSSEEAVRAVKPDFTLLRQVDARGVIVTSAASASGYDFVSRFFAPAIGVDEDPVTGSAHCCLTPYWSEKLGKRILSAYQASERGGVLEVELKEERVLIRGKAVTVFKGMMET